MASLSVPAHYTKVIHDLVEHHRKKKDEPLLLAIRFAPKDPKDVGLFEVIENFPGDADDQLFVTDLEASRDLPILGRLRLILANPDQVESAVKRRDRALQPIKRRGNVVYPPKSKWTPKVRTLIEALGLA